MVCSRHQLPRGDRNFRTSTFGSPPKPRIRFLIEPNAGWYAVSAGSRGDRFAYLMSSPKSGWSDRGNILLRSLESLFCIRRQEVSQVGPLSLGFMAIPALDFSPLPPQLRRLRTHVYTQCPGLEWYKYQGGCCSLSPAPAPRVSSLPSPLASLLFCLSVAMLSFTTLAVLAIAAQSLFAGVDAAVLR